MDEHVDLNLEEVEKKRKMPIVFPEKRRLNIGHMTHLILAKKDENPDDDDWRERWYQAHRTEEGIKKIAEDREREALAAKSKRDFIHENVDELHRMESRNRRKKHDEKRLEHDKLREERIQKIRNAKLAEHYREDSRYKSDTDLKVGITDYKENKIKTQKILDAQREQRRRRRSSERSDKYKTGKPKSTKKSSTSSYVHDFT